MNFMITLLGWFLWNWAELTITQKEYEEDGDDKTVFTVKMYAQKQWTTWVGSFFSMFVLLTIGYKQFNLDPLESLIGVKLGWSDLYLFASGAAWDMIIFLIKRIKKILKKKEQE